MTFELAIFDCDGVLVDSEPLANRILCDELRRAGLAIDSDDAHRTFVGLTLSRTLELAAERLGRPLPPGFADRLQRRTFEAFRRELEPVPGVRRALDAVAIPACVASSGAPEKMRLTLGLTGLLERFEGRLFSAVEVARGKPCPDLFLHAARQMEATAGTCVVIEDSEPGVRAGVAAGMTVLGYAPDAAQARRLAAAGATSFAAMEELPALIRRGGGCRDRPGAGL